MIIRAAPRIPVKCSAGFPSLPISSPHGTATAAPQQKKITVQPVRPAVPHKFFAAGKTGGDFHFTPRTDFPKTRFCLCTVLTPMQEALSRNRKQRIEVSLLRNQRIKSSRFNDSAIFHCFSMPASSVCVTTTLVIFSRPRTALDT